jgi:site-specific recombinase XerD
LDDGDNLRTMKELLGHANVETTMLNTHVLTKGGRGVIRPRDALG